MAHATSIAPPLLIEVPVRKQESEWLRICVLRCLFCIYFSDLTNGVWNYSGSVVLFALHCIFAIKNALMNGSEFCGK